MLICLNLKGFFMRIVIGQKQQCNFVSLRGSSFKNKYLPGNGLFVHQIKSVTGILKNKRRFFRKYNKYLHKYFLPLYSRHFLYLTLLRNNLFISILDKNKEVLYCKSRGAFLKLIGSGKVMTKLTVGQRAQSLCKELITLRRWRLKLIVNRKSGRYPIITHFIKALLNNLPQGYKRFFYISSTTLMTSLKFNGTRRSRLARKRRTYRPKVRRYY